MSPCPPPGKPECPPGPRLPPGSLTTGLTWNLEALPLWAGDAHIPGSQSTPGPSDALWGAPTGAGESAEPTWGGGQRVLPSHWEKACKPQGQRPFENLLKAVNARPKNAQRAIFHWCQEALRPPPSVVECQKQNFSKPRGK